MLEPSCRPAMYHRPRGTVLAAVPSGLPRPAGSQATATPAAPTAGPSGNHPTSVLSARINPADVTLDTELRVDIQGEDADGDGVTYRYQWVVNGVPAPGATAPVFKPERLKKGDQVTTEIVPTDGKADGAVFTTGPVTIGNTAPSIVEIHLEPVPLHRGETLKVNVVVADPDEDPVTLELKQGPPGMTLDPATKQLSWKLTPENLGKHHVVLVAKDNDNGSTQVEFDLDAQPPAKAAQGQ